MTAEWSHWQDVGSANGEAIRSYVADQRMRDHRADTIRVRVQTLRMLAGSLTVPLLQAPADDVYGWYMTHLESATWTRITYARGLRSFYRWARDRGHRDDDPTVGLPIPKAPVGRPRPAPSEDIALALEAAADDERLRLWIALAACAGLRAGEIARLRREHVRDRMHPPLLEVIGGKGGYDRTVTIGRNLAALCLAWRTTRGLMWNVTPRHVTLRVSRHFGDLGMGWTCHSLRHSYGSTVYQRSGADIRLTQDQLGHRSIASTAIYTAWGPRVAVEAVDGIDDDLLGSQEGLMA